MGPFSTLLFASLILLSALLSASEIALFSLSRFQMRFLKESIRPAIFRKIRRLLQDPGGLLITILAVNEVINVSISSMITRNIATQHFSWGVSLCLGTLIATPVILLVCEVTPKIFGARANQLVATGAATPLALMYDALKPLRSFLKAIVKSVARTAAKPGKGAPGDLGDGSGDAVLKESEFLMMVEEGHKQGAILQSELELIRSVFDLDDTRVQDVYTPLVQVQTLVQGTTLKNALGSLRSRRFSRIPITNSNRKQVLGILYTKDLLLTKLDPKRADSTVSELMRKPLVVAPSMQLNALFRKFKQHQNHMAVVQRNSGETLGVVTMSDVLDSLFEELLDEEPKR